MQAFGAVTGQALLAMITRARRSEWPFDAQVIDLAAAGLSQGCFIRMKLFTLDTSLIIRRIGTLAKADADQLQKTLAHHLGYGDGRI